MDKRWNKKIYLTFDMDWAIDDVLEDFYELIKKYDLVGTIHVTHQTQMLSVFRKEGLLELGIHPNYNLLLQGEDDLGGGRTYIEVLDNLMQIVPEAISLRSHALTNSSMIQQEYERIGLKYDLNTLIPAREGMVVFPFDSLMSDFKILPFIYEDDVYMNLKNKLSVDFFLSDKYIAPRIFNFHPIHLFLNTDKMETYEKARPYFKDASVLNTMKNKKNYGTRDFFIDLVTGAKERHWKFERIKEGDWT